MTPWNDARLSEGRRQALDHHHNHNHTVYTSKYNTGACLSSPCQGPGSGLWRISFCLSVCCLPSPKQWADHHRHAWQAYVLGASSHSSHKALHTVMVTHSATTRSISSATRPRRCMSWAGHERNFRPFVMLQQAPLHNALLESTLHTTRRKMEGHKHLSLFSAPGPWNEIRCAHTRKLRNID